MSPLCLIGVHSWVAMKWGGARPAPSLDARSCRRCPRFEIWGYDRFWKANRENFEPLAAARLGDDQ